MGDTFLRDVKNILDGCVHELDEIHSLFCKNPISDFTRNRKLSFSEIMQAVGMIGKQLNRSLTLQGLIYTGGTLLISLIVGIPLGYLAFAKFKSIAGFGMNVYHFPMVEIVSMTAVMLLMMRFLRVLQKWFYVRPS